MLSTEQKVQVEVVKFSLYVKNDVALSIFELLYNDIRGFVIFNLIEVNIL